MEVEAAEERGGCGMKESPLEYTQPPSLVVSMVVEGGGGKTRCDRGSATATLPNPRSIRTIVEGQGTGGGGLATFDNRERLKT
jgi:hypothetical protein